ncbi:MAG: serine/threonine protein kinase, partial [Planctomycetales bacterium]|nr:serine/threonine protein kinase [Planctomycetales bacterium]
MELLAQSDALAPDELDRAKKLLGDCVAPKEAARKLVGAGLLTRWQASQLLKEQPELLTLGKYVLLERLPWGSSRATFLARHPMMDRKVALNVLFRGSRRHGDSVQDFLSDARAIASLDHRNLIHVYDVDEADDRHFLVTEYVDGENLHDLVSQSGPLSVQVAADVVRQIADGLDYAHNNGLVHGSLRPTNVLLDAQGAVKILDLGVSKLREPTTPPTDGSDSQVLAVADYLSPEQAAGKPASRASDIYSLGCIAYWALSGRAPFGKGTYAERLKQHLNDSPPSLTKLRAEAPPELAAIIEGMIAKDPQKRPASAKAVGEAIHQWWQQH